MTSHLIRVAVPLSADGMHGASPMSLNRVTPPATQPVTIATLADHLRIAQSAPETEQSAELGRLIDAATTHIERRLDTALIAQSWRWQVERWCDAALFPLAPVITVETVDLVNGDGTRTLWTGWRLKTSASRPRLAVQSAQLWSLIPTDGHAEIRFTVGYGTSPEDVPPDLRHAVLLLAGHYFENREAIADPAAPIPLGVASLLAPYRPIRL